jgi:hypothetical protein
MRFLILMSAGEIHDARVMPRESTETGQYGAAPAMADGRCPFPPAAHVRFSAHKMSVVDGPFPETKQ